MIAKNNAEGGATAPCVVAEVGKIVNPLRLEDCYEIKWLVSP